MISYALLAIIAAVLVSLKKHDAAFIIVIVCVTSAAYDAKEAHKHTHDIACALDIKEALPFCHGEWD